MYATSIPGFEILEQIQASSKTLIWRARQHSLDRIVTLKLLQPEAAVQPAELARFLLVARTLARLKADGLAQIFDVVSEGECHYIVMESVDGPTLTDLVGQKGSLPVAQAVRIAITVAEALGQAWNAGRLVHRNLKPTGIRLDARGVAKLTDFGQAVLAVNDYADATGLDAGHIVGTPNFLSPEQSAGVSQLDCRADMYALGAVLYYLVTGHMPFCELPAEAVIKMQIYGQLPHPHTFRADLPTPVCGLIERLTMKLPDDRYATWTEAMGDMQHVLKNLPLRRRETAPKGTATIAPEAPSTAPRAVNKRPAPPAGRPLVSTTTAIPPARPQANMHHGAFMRVVLWLLLIGWFVVLANDRLGDPMRLGFDLSSAAAQIRARFAPPSTSITGQTRPVTPIQKPAAPVVAVRPATPPESTPSPEPNSPRHIPLDPVMLSPELTGRLSVALSRGDLDAARTMLRNTPDSPAVMAARDLLAETPDINQLTEEGIMRSRNQEVEIEFMGKKRMVVPQRVINGEIYVNTAADKRTVSFRTDRLSAAERLRWVGPLNTPAKQIAVCALMLQAGDVAYVAEKAAACGMLAPAFAMAANR